MNNKEGEKLYVDEHVVRIIAAQVIVVTAISLLTRINIPIFLLSLDFGIRAFSQMPSPLAVIAKSIVRLLKLKSKPNFAAPKKFAAGIGFVFALVIFFFLVFKLYTMANIVGFVLIFFALLESVFKICVGCYFYYWFVGPKVNQ